MKCLYCKLVVLNIILIKIHQNYVLSATETWETQRLKNGNWLKNKTVASRAFSEFSISRLVFQNTSSLSLVASDESSAIVWMLLFLLWLKARNLVLPTFILTPTFATDVSTLFNNCCAWSMSSDIREMCQISYKGSFTSDKNILQPMLRGSIWINRPSSALLHWIQTKLS